MARPPIDCPWKTHDEHLARHPAIQGTPLAENGCPGMLVCDSWTPRGGFTVRCEGCWRAFAVGPQPLSTIGEAMF